FNVLHSAFALLLARLSGQHDLTIGLPVTGRHIYGTQDMLGMFLNNLPVRHQLDLQQPYSEYLGEQIDNIAGVLSNQDIPLERILELESVATTRSTDSTPLFQVLFNMLSLPDENQEAKPKDAAPNVTISGAQTAQTNSKFDLTFYVQDAAEGVAISCSYHSGKFTGQAIDGLLAQYVSLLTQVAEDIHQPCGQYSLNVGAQRIDHASDLPAYWPGSVVELFRQQAQQSPDAIAVEEPTQQWTYLDLLELCDATSAQLTEAGVGEGDVVAIVATRQTSVVVAIMATLQIGAVYCIVTPDQPQLRVKQQLNIVNPAAILLTRQSACSTELLEDLSTIATCLEVAMTLACSDVVVANIKPNQAACITFTSGSTGVPKAVIGKHQGLSGYLQWLPQQMSVDANDRFSLLSGLTHDPLQRDIFGALCLGAILVIPDETAYADLALSAWMAQQRITVAHLTPAMTQVLCVESNTRFDDLRVAFITGEKLRRDTAELLRDCNPQTRIVNCYGATETQRALTYFELGDMDNLPTVVPIATQSIDTRLRLINPAGGDCGMGEVGEICVESHHIALGYLNDDDLNKSRFGAGFYRTGDLAIYTCKDQVKPLGRSDNQISLRGFRIELGEIEAQLTQLADINSAVVVATEQQLVAFVVTSNQTVDMALIRTELQQSLPDYMVPAHIVAIDSFPLNASGKIDNLGLLQQANDLSTGCYVAPTT
ncbi:MAG: AMP-binding protein, partial [Algicola sp.]|nr:AMP-binding protein [Algicola sp.]